jgi:hypothetical protein
MSKGWIGVDFDGTLARDDGYTWPPPPVPAMVERVKGWLAEGREVRLVTARAADLEWYPDLIDWMNAHLGQRLEITNQKDYGMIELWDDRAVRVARNTGERTL